MAAVVSMCGGVEAQQFAIPPEIRELVDPGPPLAGSRDGLVLEGLRLFMEEDFGGNGRTCATCHPPTHNFTIDADFIRDLPDQDPLFVAESIEGLEDLEVPKLLRERGLILENLDSFDEPGVMRGVPHTLGLSQSIATDMGTATRPPFPLIEMTGWSGDGAPGLGSLREFAIGAVAQHFPRSLERRACSTAAFDPSECDFRVPTDPELDAMEAFQLFLGRQEEINIEPDSAAPNEIVFLDPRVENGKLLFEESPALNADGTEGGARGCGGCHNNAGSNDSSGNGRQRATGANMHPNSPACDLSGEVAGDGGFGPTPAQQTIPAASFCPGGASFELLFRGDMTFNVPSVIEAADTPPFFHNNIVETIEEAVEFYTTDVFGDSDDGNGRKFVLTDAQIEDIAALLRAVNARDNILNGNRYDELARRQLAIRPELAVFLIEMAHSETEDAIQVLSEEPIPLYEGAGVIQLLEEAGNAELQATVRRNPSLLNRAIRLKNEALKLMVLVL